MGGRYWKARPLYPEIAFWTDSELLGALIPMFWGCAPFATAH